ncbi:MAG: peptide-binding protein [Pseudomonadota bacterium]
MLFRFVLAAVLTLLPVRVLAEPPELFKVINVASDDVLNIRASASAQSEILGAYPFDADGIEVVAIDPSGRWAMVGLPEGNGWVARRFLASDPVDRPLKCFGTEPFWSLTVAEPDSTLVTPDIGPLTLNTSRAQSFLQTSSGIQGMELNGLDHSLSAIIRPRQCNDGMSDREFGWGIDLLWRMGFGGEGGSELVHVTGCCTKEDR